LVDVKTGNGLLKTVFMGNEWESEIPLEMQFTSHTILEYGLSSWYELDGFSIGYTMKYLQGINLFKLYSDSQSEPLYTDSTGLKLNFMLRRELYPGGSGYAMDIGFLTKESESGWSLGFSVINMFGYINWDKHNLNYVLFGKPITESTGLTAFKSEVIGFEINNLNATDLMSGSIEISDTVVSDTSFSEDLNYPIYKSDYPTMIRFGLSKVIENNLQIAIESKTGFQEEGITPVKWIHSIGFEVIKWRHIPFRIGFSSGSDFNHKIGFGIGLHFNPINIDAGLSWTGSRKMYTATGMEFGLTVTLLR